MTNSYVSVTTKSLKLFTAVLCLFLTCTKMVGADRTAPPVAPVSAQHTVRDLDMRIQVNEKSGMLKLTITNRASKMRFLRVPLDLTPFRIRLTDKDGWTLKMTPKGTQRLTEFAIGSVGIYELKHEKPRSFFIDLSELFEIPPKKTIRCEVSRLVFFTNPRNSPAEKEWLAFPGVTFTLH